jgi:UCH-binding domain
MELALQEDGKFWVTPDTRRLQVNIKYNTGTSTNGGDSSLPQGLLWEWYDRKEKKTLETLPVTDPIKLSRADVPKSQDLDSNDRVYYWKVDNEWRMLWLQDKEDDPELIDKANELLKEPKKRRGDDEETPGVVAPSPGNASTSSASTTTRQVDALSSILENLGTADGAGAAAGTAGASGAQTSSGGTARTLTLADLQGAMSGLQQQQEANTHVGLQEIVTTDVVISLLENEEVRQRLLQELPEGQRSEAFLEENLRSPQVQQTLRSLTMALMPDDNGSMDGYHSVLANFQLDASDGQAALAAGKSPIQAFLDCVLASVEKEQSKESEDAGDETKEEETKDQDGDAEMKD